MSFSKKFRDKSPIKKQEGEEGILSKVLDPIKKNIAQNLTPTGYDDPYSRIAKSVIRIPDDYKNKLLPKRGCLKITIEAGITAGWEKYSGLNGLEIGLDHYGASAPGKDLANEFGFTAHKVEEKIRSHLDTLL